LRDFDLSLLFTCQFYYLDSHEIRIRNDVTLIILKSCKKTCISYQQETVMHIEIIKLKKQKHMDIKLYAKECCEMALL